MTPEHWQQVKQIFDSAVQLEASDRNAFLSNACGDNHSLRKEVESLIEAHERDGSFIDRPVFQVSNLLQPNELKAGQSVGSYVIASSIGRGGMGEVYLANDTRLSRKVALKILPTSVMKDAERMRRFEQEARAASALNHPNIITIYEVSEADSTLMIATEFVEGITLRDRMSAGPVTLRDALNIAIQIADALSAAHKAGIIHRDIKPENIMIRPDGYVKVLDFGLAKLTEPSFTKPSTEATTQIKTGSGVVMGTIGYMSPEQARGQSVDGRSDIFNLGTVIYELIAGHGPFKGETPSDVFAAILKSEPASLSEVAPGTPPELIAIVDKALRKDRKERYQDINALLSDLRNVKEDVDFQAKLDRSVSPSQKINGHSDAATLIIKPNPTAPQISTFEHLRRNRLTVAVGLMVLVTGVVGGYFLLKRIGNGPAVNLQIPATAQLQGTQLTSWAGFDCYPSLSPDGNSLAYSSDRNGHFEIYVKQLTPGGREVQLTSDGLENFEAAWSPDGKWIAYASKNRGGIWIVPSLGGTARQLTESGSFPSWSPDGSSIAFQSAGISDDLGAIASGALLPSTIRVVSSQGGQERSITQVGDPPGGHGAPAWSPDGKQIAFGSFDPEKTELWITSVESGKPRKLAVGYDPAFSPDGKNIYFASFGNNLNFSVSKIALSEKGEPLGEPLQIVGRGPGRYKRLSISADGKKLVYGTVQINSNILAVPLTTRSESAGEPLPLTRDTSFRNSNPVFSPDGSKIAYHVVRVGTQSDIYVMNRDGGNQIQVTTNPGSDTRPTWFSDNEQIAFLSRRGGKDEIWAVSLRSGRERKLIGLDQDITFPHLSPDGTQIVFNSKKSGTTNMWVVRADGGEPRQLTFDKEASGFGCWSPDSKHIAFELKRGDNNFLAIMPVAGGELRQLNSGQGQSWPFSFSRDGDKIAFAGFRDGYWNVWWYSLSTKQEKQITQYKKLNAFVRYTSWSPVEEKIAFEYAETTGNIFLVEMR